MILGMYAGKLDEQGPEGLPGRAKGEEERALGGGRGPLEPRRADAAGRER